MTNNPQAFPTKERPIIFNAEMVCAILEGRKTQTRRPMKPQPKPCAHHKFDSAEWKDNPTEFYMDERGHWCCKYCGNGTNWIGDGIKCPFGQPGDRLWVRETFFCNESDKECAQDLMSVGEGIYYKASEENPSIFSKWRPSIHMPRWASRITLEITNISVERIQDISNEDAIAEGIARNGSTFNNSVADSISIKYGAKGCRGSASSAFAQGLWEPIYPGSWERNDWVWVVEFKMLEARNREGKT